MATGNLSRVYMIKNDKKNEFLTFIENLLFTKRKSDKINMSYIFQFVTLVHNFE